MNELNKHPIAIGLIAILLCFKIIFIPIIDWQDQKLAKLALLDKKIDKINYLLSNEDVIEQQSQEIEIRLNDVSERFFPAQNGDKFKLEQQKLIESHLKQYELSITNIGWKNRSDVSGVPLKAFRIEYGVSGKTVKVIDYLLSITNQEPMVELTGLTFKFRKQSIGKLGSVSARIRQEYYLHNNLNESEIQEDSK